MARPWEIIDEAPVPGGDGTLYLMARGSEYRIRVDDRDLMSNREHGSEAGLADLACDRLERLDDARILVGGLGMGFTLAATLRRLGSSGSVTVAEISPAVVRWNRDHVAAAAKYPLRDPRVVVRVGDVGDLVENPPAPWSAILLDVDNGPRSLTRAYNGWLYSRQGLAAAYAALIPGGVLGIWSAKPDARFTRRLHQTGFDVEVLPFTEEGRATDDHSGTHILWMVRRPYR